MARKHGPGLLLPGLPLSVGVRRVAAAPSGPPLDGLSPTAAWSASRELLTSFAGGSKYTDAGGGAISSFNDQTGNGRHLTDGGTSTRRPTLTTAGPLSVACLDFDGASDFLSGAAYTSFFSASSKFAIFSVIFDSITSVTDPVFATTGHTVISDTSGVIGLWGSTDGGLDKVYASSYQAAGGATPVSRTITEGTAYVITLRHESNVLYVTANGSEASTAATDTFASGGNLQMGKWSGSDYLDGKVCEGATFQTIPDASARAALIANFTAQIGA